MAKATAQYTITAVYDGSSSTDSDIIQYIVTNEYCSIATNQSGDVYDNTDAYTLIKVFRGTKNVTGDYTVTKDDPTGITTSLSEVIEDDYIDAYKVLVTSTNIAVAGGVVKLHITRESETVDKDFTINVCSDTSQAYDYESVNIVNDGNVVFKSTNGNEFTPEYINLVPIYNNCSYSKWQYSTDNENWNDITQDMSGVTVGTIPKYEVTVDGDGVDTLAHALDALVDNEEKEIILLQDVFIHYQLGTSSSRYKKVIINLDGHKIINDSASSAVFDNYCNLTLRNGTIESEASASIVNIKIGRAHV